MIYGHRVLLHGDAMQLFSTTHYDLPETWDRDYWSNDVLLGSTIELAFITL